MNVEATALENAKLFDQISEDLNQMVSNRLQFHGNDEEAFKKLLTFLFKTSKRYRFYLIDSLEQITEIWQRDIRSDELITDFVLSITSELAFRIQTYSSWLDIVELIYNSVSINTNEYSAIDHDTLLRMPGATDTVPTPRDLFFANPWFCVLFLLQTMIHINPETLDNEVKRRERTGARA